MKHFVYVIASLLLAGFSTLPELSFFPISNTSAMVGRAASVPKAQVDTQYTHFFTRYAAWNGGDGVYSTLLPDGRIVWTFGDTFLGLVKSDRTRLPNQNVMVRNSMMIQSGETFYGFKTLNKGAHTTQAGQTYFNHAKQPGGNDWYWPLDATVYDRKLQVLLSHIQKTGSGSWDFKNASIDIAICSASTGAIEKIIVNKYQGQWGYGGAVCEAADGYTYIYGVIHGTLTTNVVVARVPKGDLMATWQFWNGSQWEASRTTFRSTKMPLTSSVCFDTVLSIISLHRKSYSADGCFCRSRAVRLAPGLQSVSSTPFPQNIARTKFSLTMPWYIQNCREMAT